MGEFPIRAFLAHRRRVLRACIRGYARLRSESRIGLVRRIKEDLSDCVLEGSLRYASPLLFGESHGQSERVVRQFLIQRLAGIALNKKILESIGNPAASVAYPLPEEWRRVLVARGINVADVKSRLAWIAAVAAYFGYGVLNIAEIASRALLATLRPRLSGAGRYAYFHGLSATNLPSGDGSATYDICTWYARWEGRLPGIDIVRHSVQGEQSRNSDGLRLEYIAKPFHMLRSGRDALRFLAWGMAATTLAAADALRGRWWHALMLAEAARAKAVELCAQGLLAAEYLFPYSGTVYRPMWTYEAQARGARIVCFFYSTSEQVKLSGGYESQRYEWGVATWPLYLVWDRYQEDVIRRDIGQSATIKVVGPIWFTDSPIELPALPDRSIAVFDLQPIRRAAHFGFSTTAEFIETFPDTQMRFLEDVHLVLSECGATMVFKQKRDIGRKTVKKYQGLVKTISASPNAVIVSPDISPIRVIEKCRAMISMPFTSTALYQRDQGIPSAYYDPTGWLQKDDRGAHGIPLLSGIDELRDWVRAVLAKEADISLPSE